MLLNSATSNLLIAWYLLGSLVNVALLAVLVITLSRLNQRIAALESRVDPALRQTEALLTEVNARLTTVGGSAERILAQGEAITGRVEAQTEATVGLVQRAVYLPFVHVNALLAAALQTVQTFGTLQRRAPSSNSDTDPERNP